MIVSKLTFQVVTWGLGILFAGNIFFVKRLVDQQDKMSDIVWQLRQDVTVMKLTFDQKQFCKTKLKGE